MKIYQFIPPGAIQPGAEKPAAARSPSQNSAGRTGGDFASILKAATAGASGRPEGPSQSVGLENQRAARLPSAGDLSQARNLVSRLDADIRASAPETLKNVHRLEGLLCVYRQAGE